MVLQSILIQRVAMVNPGSVTTLVLTIVNSVTGMMLWSYQLESCITGTLSQER